MPSKNKSPLRYPGGKTRAISFLQDILETEYPTRKILLSPFLGGGSFELAMAANEYTVKANDLFCPLTTFWKEVKDRPQELAAAIQQKMPVTKEKFLEFRTKILTETNPLQIAAMYFIINRCSFSGATFCGGYSQQAAEGRLTQSSLETLKQVNLTRFTISNQDVLTFLEQNPQTEQTVLYADPPYFISSYIYGRDGDLHQEFNHKAFAQAIQKRSDWMISYNDCEYIRSLYPGCRFLTPSWAYGMNKSKKSSEILILPPSS
jgi:DNA adenine methylase